MQISSAWVSLNSKPLLVAKGMENSGWLGWTMSHGLAW